jgi:hypothetical protein
MSHTCIIRGNREFAHRLIDCAPVGSVVKVSAPKRTVDQNAKLWATLSEISAAKPEGRTMTPDCWKAVFMHALDFAQRFEMALDGNGMVPVGFRSSKLTKQQMSDLFEVIHEYAARHGVALSHQESPTEGRRAA